MDSPEVNAFALPGGHIYVTRGILAYLNSEAELAAVLKHEISHVTKLAKEPPLGESLPLTRSSKPLNKPLLYPALPEVNKGIYSMHNSPSPVFLVALAAYRA